MRIIIAPFFVLVLLLSRIETNEAANLKKFPAPSPLPGRSPAPSPQPGSGVSGKNVVGPKKVSSAPSPLPSTSKKPSPLPSTSKQNNVPSVPKKSTTRA
ncbi:hypothetical protein EJD97_016286 [Solanum chilense]|uniref:Uncharacterized protein n=1 Tax=Solanum chilense TaxID=4083 RepID=A0A6N2AG59_SOLCI|nr:hypothetical protein EJD97_016286 [Solanum chilense]